MSFNQKVPFPSKESRESTVYKGSDSCINVGNILDSVRLPNNNEQEPKRLIERCTALFLPSAINPS